VKKENILHIQILNLLITLKNYPNQHHPTNQSKSDQNPRSSKAKIATTLQKTPVKPLKNLKRSRKFLENDEKEFEKLYCDKTMIKKNDQACKAAQQKKVILFFKSKKKTNATNSRRRDPFLKIAKQNIQLIVPDKTLPVALHCPPPKNCEMTLYSKKV